MFAVLGLMINSNINASTPLLPKGALAVIEVINLPANHLVAAKVNSGNSVQTPIAGTNMYAIYPNVTYYTITRVKNKGKKGHDTIISKGHTGNEFIDKTTWDATSDIIFTTSTTQMPVETPTQMPVNVIAAQMPVTTPAPLPKGAIAAIKVINLPVNHLVAVYRTEIPATAAGGWLNRNLVQTPIDGKNLYAIKPNTEYYIITRVEKITYPMEDTIVTETIKSKKHQSTEFKNMNTWDAKTDTIMNIPEAPVQA